MESLERRLRWCVIGPLRMRCCSVRASSVTFSYSTDPLVWTRLVSLPFIMFCFDVVWFDVSVFRGSTGTCLMTVLLLCVFCADARGVRNAHLADGARQGGRRVAGGARRRRPVKVHGRELILWRCGTWCCCWWWWGCALCCDDILKSNVLSLAVVSMPMGTRVTTTVWNL